MSAVFLRLSPGTRPTPLQNRMHLPVADGSCPKTTPEKGGGRTYSFDGPAPASREDCVRVR